MTDQYDASGQIPRRSVRTGDGAGAAGGAVAIALALIAVVAGFFILRSLSDDGARTADFPNAVASGNQNQATPQSVVTTAPANTTPSSPPSTEAPYPVTAGAQVVVVNANGVRGSAGKMSDALKEIGYQTVKPTDASSSLGRQNKTAVYYDETNPQAQAVAESIATSLGGKPKVQALSGTPPTKDGTLGGAHVMVLLGKDLANKNPADLVKATASSNTAPPVATAATQTTAG